jgi:hypothetical protein
MEWLYWIILIVGAVVLSTGCLMVAQSRRRAQVVVIDDARAERS